MLPVEVREGEGRNEKWARLEPHDGFALAFSIDFRHPAIDSTANFAEIDFATHSYVREIARARTFGFVNEVEALRSMGLARGGSLDNAIVMDEYRVLNSDGLRYDDEFVKQDPGRHRRPVFWASRWWPATWPASPDTD